jgi:membrane-bound lytic murein transglycosylase F
MIAANHIVGHASSLVAISRLGTRLVEPKLPVEGRMWFTLPEFNAGNGNMKDARRLARNLCLNPNRWFGNVEKAIFLLSKPKYARHGYCRGAEPVKNVREIKHRYEASRQVKEL